MDEIPLDLLRVIYRALSKEPATRYQSCREMVADLKDFRKRLDPAATAAQTARQPSSLSASELRAQVEQASRPMWGMADVPGPRWNRWLAVWALAQRSYFSPASPPFNSEAIPY
jgi:hypothetical protein